MKTRMIAPLKKGILVGIQGNVGCFPLIDRLAPNLYRVLVPFRDTPMGVVVLIPRNQISILAPGRYLFMGQSENFVEIK